MVKLTAIALGISTALISLSALADTPCNNIPQWDKTQVYEKAGVEVQYEQKLYQNKYWNQGAIPSDGGPWQSIGNCSYLPT